MMNNEGVLRMMDIAVAGQKEMDEIGKKIASLGGNPSGTDPIDILGGDLEEHKCLAYAYYKLRIVVKSQKDALSVCMKNAPEIIQAFLNSKPCGPSTARFEYGVRAAEPNNFEVIKEENMLALVEYGAKRTNKSQGGLRKRVIAQKWIES